MTRQPASCKNCYTPSAEMLGIPVTLQAVQAHRLHPTRARRPAPPRLQPYLRIPAAGQDDGPALRRLNRHRQHTSRNGSGSNTSVDRTWQIRTASAQLRGNSCRPPGPVADPCSLLTVDRATRPDAGWGSDDAGLHRVGQGTPRGCGPVIAGGRRSQGEHVYSCR